MRLHLGCGERYFEGYVNIDYPPSEHTVQQKSVADLHADLLALRYPNQSIEEVRLHHVFEHFPRQVACALVASWQAWLQRGGLLHIEVPDLLRTGLAIINPFASSQRRLVAERHLFGSHEAPWAAHKEGYTAKQLRNLLEAFGLAVRHVRRNHWLGTYNFEMLAFKNENRTRAECTATARAYLRQYLVDFDTEQRLLDIWLEQYERQVAASWPVDA